MNFKFYSELGWQHITDLNGYDHILFIIAISVLYHVKDWKRLLWMVTAFTLGHSISLFLAVSEIIQFSSYWVELLIPVSILLTLLIDLNRVDQLDNYNSELRLQPISWIYILTMCFGLIHGLGFSNFLKESLASGESILLPLFAFNLGLEIGQIIILLIYMLISGFFIHFLNINRKSWAIFVIGIIFGISSLLIIERI